MTNKGLVSLVVPVFNGSKYLSECLNSILNQTYKKIELIIVDDGSEDNSYTIAKKFANKDDRVILIKHLKNMGEITARNTGIGNARGEFITFVDGDDTIKENYCEVFVSNIKDNDLCLCNQYIYFQWENRLREQNFNFKRIKILNNPPVSYVFDGTIPGYTSSKFYRKDSLRKLRFDPALKIGEDNVFIWKYLEQGARINYVNDYLYTYRWYKTKNLESLEPLDSAGQAVKTEISKFNMKNFLWYFKAGVNFFLRRSRSIFLIFFHIIFYILGFFIKSSSKKNIDPELLAINLKFYGLIFNQNASFKEMYNDIKLIKSNCPNLNPHTFIKARKEKNFTFTYCSFEIFLFKKPRLIFFIMMVKIFLINKRLFYRILKQRKSPSKPPFKPVAEYRIYQKP